MSHKRIAIFSVLGQFVRVISGPIVLLFIAKSLTDDEKMFYFTFFNLIALQQILEMGVGYTLKQFISHSFINDKISGNTKKYYIFSLIWFTTISFLFLIFIGGGGYLFFQSYNGNIAWKEPWFLLIIISSCAMLFIPFQILLEGVQQQVVVYKSKVIGSAVGTLVTILSLNYNMGLYSPAIGLAFNTLLTFAFYFPNFCKIKKIMKGKVDFEFLVVLKELLPLLSRVSVTWVLGYLLWNSFNLIAFKTLSVELSAKLGMTIALCKAGYSIADSLISSQLTLFGNQISNKKTAQSLSIFKKYFILGFSGMLVGFGVFIFLAYEVKLFDFYENITDVKVTFSVMVFSLLVFFISTHNNFCRCFKYDPNFKNSLLLNLSVPVFTYFSFSFFSDGDFFFIIIPTFLCALWSLINFKKTISMELLK